MSAALTVTEYVNYFLINNSDPESSENHVLKNDDIILSHVNQTKPVEQMIYSRKITGNKTSNVFLEFTRDMIGSVETHKINSRTQPTAVLDYKSSADAVLICSKCPGKVGAEHLQDLLNECKRRAIKLRIQIKFAHSYSWDNKYNRIALKQLVKMGVKLSPMCMNMIVNQLMTDIEETLLSFDQLQTCRGTLSINPTLLKSAMCGFRSSICVDSDEYYRNQNTELSEILGLPATQESSKAENNVQPTTLSMETYRDYFLLQNSDHVWGKLKVEISKINDSETKNETVYETILFVDLTSTINTRYSFGKKNEKTSKRKQLDKEDIWQKISGNITMNDIFECNNIIVMLNTIISEYPDAGGLHQETRDLEAFLSDKIQECKLAKVRTDLFVRYAQHGTEIRNGNEGRKHMECLHVQDILFEMLEDLDDNLSRLGKLEYKRGCSLGVNKEEVSMAMESLNKSIGIQIGTDSETVSMNQDFDDEYANEFNGK